MVLLCSLYLGSYIEINWRFSLWSATNILTREHLGKIKDQDPHPLPPPSVVGCDLLTHMSGCQHLSVYLHALSSPTHDIHVSASLGDSTIHLPICCWRPEKGQSWHQLDIVKRSILLMRRQTRKRKTLLPSMIYSSKKQLSNGNNGQVISKDDEISN